MKATVQTPANMYCQAHMQILFRIETLIKSFITQIIFSDLCYRMGCAAVCHKPSLDPIFRVFKLFFSKKNRHNKTGALQLFSSRKFVKFHLT